MSGWTVITMEGKKGKDYDYSRWDNHDQAHAVEDLCASVEADDRVHRWTMDSPYVYAYLRCDRYDWEFAETFMEDYETMLRRAIVLGANDTTDTGTARYYPSPTYCTDEYKETQEEDGTHVGQIALAVIGGRHGMVARDPFHGWVGEFDERYAEKGSVRAEGAE